MRPHPGTLSVVVPCYNEQDVIETTHRRLVEALEPLGMAIELIYVDDGSKDETPAILRQIAAGDERAKLVLLARNFGHQLAVTAGIDHAEGDAVVIIDADLQDPPEAIPEMVRYWRDGDDVVYAQRIDRAGEKRMKLWTSKLFYRLLDMLADTPIPLDTGDFRLIDRRVADHLRQMPERDRFVRGMVSWVGFRQRALPFHRAERYAGRSKYSLIKLCELAANGVLSFSIKPLRLAIAAGAIAIVFAIAALGYGTAALLGGAGQGRVSLLLAAMFMLSGVQLVSIGILGEYVGRIYLENKRRPLYVVGERCGFDRGKRVKKLAA